MQLEIIDNAYKHIEKEFDDKQIEIIFEKLRFFADNYDEVVKTKQVEKLTNSQASRFKINIGIRAIFITFYENNDGTIIILDVVKRENAYTNRNMTQFNKLAKETLDKKKADLSQDRANSNK